MGARSRFSHSEGADPQKKAPHHVQRPAKAGRSFTDESNRIIRSTFIASVAAFVLSSLTTSIGSLIDGVVIGKFLGMDSLEAFSLVSPVLIVFSLIGAVIASSARNRFTTMTGGGDIAGARGVFTLSAALGAGLPTLLLIIILLFPDPICRLLGAKGSAADLLGPTRGYLIGVGVGRASNTLRTIVLNQSLTWVAVAGCIAAYGVQRQADSLLNPFIFGISDAMSTLTGILSGEENRHMLKWLTKDCFLLVCTFILALSVLFWFLSPLFAALFFDGAPEALGLAVRAARCFALGFPFCVLGHAYEGYMEGRGKTRRNMILTFLSEGGYIVLAALALQSFMGADAVWCAFPVSQLLLLLTISVIIFVSNRREKIRPKDFWEWIMGLPEDFDVPECDRIDRTITGRDGVMDLSRDAWEFCEKHGCDPRRKYFISLAVEELATNTVTYGFRPGRRNCIDMRILKKKDEYSLRPGSAAAGFIKGRLSVGQAACLLFRSSKETWHARPAPAGHGIIRPAGVFPCFPEARGTDRPYRTGMLSPVPVSEAYSISV
ncbi:MAG: hypothetical protein IKP22_02310 [Clostridia bacterium]|nr:hypothetical protein [Clostridia bacterium]